MSLRENLHFGFLPKHPRAQDATHATYVILFFCGYRTRVIQGLLRGHTAIYTKVPSGDTVYDKRHGRLRLWPIYGLSNQGRNT